MDIETLKKAYEAVNDRYEHNLDNNEEFKKGMTVAMMILVDLRQVAMDSRETLPNNNGSGVDEEPMSTQAPDKEAK